MDHLARFERRDGRANLVHTGRLLPPTILVAQAPCALQQSPVLPEVAEMAPRVPPIALEGLRILGPGALERDDPPVGEELGEGGVEELVGLVRCVVPDEVDRHVVGGPERRGQVVGPCCSEPGDAFERHLPLVNHHGVAETIDASAARPARQLGVLARRQELVPFPLELPQILDHDGLRWHVDPQRQRLRREDHLHESCLEQLLDRLLEDRDHARVVGGDAGLEPLEEVGEPERDEILIVDPGRPRLRSLPDPLGLIP